MSYTHSTDIGINGIIGKKLRNEFNSNQTITTNYEGHQLDEASTTLYTYWESEPTALELTEIDNVIGLHDDSDANLYEGKHYTKGYGVYSDSATSTTPISVTAETWTNLTCDGQGFLTDESNLAARVDRLYDSGTNKFDFCKLNIGDSLLVRVSLSVIAASIDTDVELRLNFDTGGYSFNLNLPQSVDRTVGTHKVNAIFDFFLGTDEVRNADVIAQIKSTKDCSIEVHDFYITVL